MKFDKNTFAIDGRKVRLAMAKKQFTVSGLAAAYGVSRARMNAILNQRTVTSAVLGRMAAALGVDPEEILEDE